jgi:L-aspartate oxidase
MKRYHERADLAPRDVVARAIDAELKRSGDKHVGLDATHFADGRFAERFPQIHARLAELGIRPEREPIPVVPAAHYQCGGVITGIDGTTDLAGLFACGEVAMTGLHGANRLASNSLLEALVLAEGAAEAAAGYAAARGEPAPAPEWDPGPAVASREGVLFDHDWDEVRRLMWDFVGIVRSDDRLRLARERIVPLREAIERYYWRYLLSDDLVELRNIGLLAHLIILSAARRKESRGLHYNDDHPEPDPKFEHDTVLSREDPEASVGGVP